MHYPEGKASIPTAIDPWKEHHHFLKLAALEGLDCPPAATKEQKAVLPPELNERLLEYAGKVAWRNSNRCIGRLFWKQLKVMDLRGAVSADDYFEGLLDHLRYATNNGRIRSVLTVFPAVNQEGLGARIVNHQLIRYAGYRDGQGRILGDPQNLQLTDTAVAAGWKPPAERSAFDLLPVGIQLPGKSVKWYKLPAAEVLQVPIQHPIYSWFESLGLRWYAVPVITDMCFEAAGRRYSCAPFNGWYMGTEIGARNLADVQRYNLLPLVAEKMDIDRNHPSSLWQDRALVELNRAVLYSFQKAGVTIVDHHSASAQFQQFVENERKCGRDFTGDWSWLVPPLSGSTCPLFHQSIDHTIKKPTFSYQ